MPFTPPKTTAFKQFMILDHDGVVAALSAIDGGQIDEILTRSADHSALDKGGEVNLKVAKGKRQKAKTRKVEEEMRLTRTRHAAAAKLIQSLDDKEAVGIVDGALDMEIFEQLSNGMVLRLEAELLLHPLNQTGEMLRSFIKIGPKLGEAESVKGLKPHLEMWDAILGSGDENARLLLEPETSKPQEPRLILPVPNAHLEGSLDDVLGHVTLVAQVEKLVKPGDSYQAMRFLRGAGPMSSLESDALAESVPDMLPGLREMGVDIDEEDIFMSGPAVVLRPICAYR